MVLVEQIDKEESDLIKDPCLYGLSSGTHTVMFRVADFQGEYKEERHQLDVVLKAGKYYQVLPIRNNDQLTFHLAEIDPAKPSKVYRGKIKALIGYLFSNG